MGVLETLKGISFFQKCLIYHIKHSQTPQKKLNFPIFNVNMPKYTCLRGSAAVHMLSNSDISEFYLREGVSLFQKSLNYSVWGGGTVCSDTSSKWVWLYPMPYYGHEWRTSTLIRVPINYWQNSDLLKKTFF